MRLPTLMLSLAVVLSSPVLAQPRSTSISLMGGVNSSSIRFEENPMVTSSRLTGPLVGLALTRRVNPYFAWGPELYYTKKGVKEKFAGVIFGQAISGTARTEISYIELPLLMTISARPARTGMTPFLIAGPAVSVKVGCRARASFTTAMGTETEDNNCKDPDGEESVESLDIGAILGAGLSFRSISIGARYEHGLRNLSTDSSIETQPAHRVISATIAWTLRR